MAAAMSVRDQLRFILNGEEVSVDEVRPDETLLDYLRLRRLLRGTKEGCAEGHCGACTVLVGRLKGGELVYEGINACIRFLGSLEGCHVVTIEHLEGSDGALHPVQQALVDYHGSQCGFCTPGFVMSLYALWMREPQPSDAAIEKALQGNLCRCTGYEPIIKAARAIGSYGDAGADPLVAERNDMKARLAALKDGKRVVIGEGDSKLIVPASVDDLADVFEREPSATIVAGLSDAGLWVTKFMRPIAPAIFIGGLDDLAGSEFDGERIVIGANVSFTDAYDAIASHIPAWRGLLDRIGGDQIRNMGTIGGNIANGSPIGDSPPPLIALGAEVTLRKGSARRTLRLEDFFIDYGKQDRLPGEFVESIMVPLPEPDAHYAIYKITKRRDEDITAVLAAFNVTIKNGTVTEACIAYGGMAATPKRAKAVEAAIVGKPWNDDGVEAAMSALAMDFSPISDMRASAEYRSLAARNLIRRFYLETKGQSGIMLKRYEEA